MATFYARLINYYKFKNHTFFQQAFIKVMKKIREVMKLKYLFEFY